ncbi:type II toxin-antitoxin system RelE/ParE family toxin [Patescibacteria group bacterium]|nr:type II toxin-antitoxin system RelE/ParE family toxin [Patescibacteria group bacterium]
MEVRAKFNDLFEILSKEGKLEMPFAKKIGNELLEIRVKHRGQWRAIYAYILKNQVIILSAFQKKTQKTPKKELTKALKRLKRY